MKISFKHLQDRIIQNIDINDLSEKLFQLGHEHEIEGNIFNMEFTPNRGDCLSLNGLLRDLNIFYDLKDNDQIYEKEINKFDLYFINNAKYECPKISFLKIEVDEIPHIYNGRLKSFFEELNTKKNNFFTDISNYISYETGQPTHCYNASSIKDGIKLGYFEGYEELETLLDKKIELSGKNLVFFNSENEIINLAGIIGNKSSSCKKNSKSVVIECAYFDPEAIIGKSVAYSLNSEAAHKFERNVDPDCHDFVLRRFIKIVEEHANINSLEIYSQNSYVIEPQKIHFCHNRINKVLGTTIPKEKCIKHLIDLGFNFENELIEIPSYRHDISSMNDIAEEIARAVGYDNIACDNFLLTKKKNIESVENIEAKIKNFLYKDGFSEVINNPFVSTKTDISIEVDNPLDSSKRFLRSNLKSSLINNLLYNERRQKDSIKLYEIADIYSLPLGNNKKVIGIITSGRVNNNFIDFTKKLDKNYLSNLLEKYIKSDDIFNYEYISRDSIRSKLKSEIIYVEFEITSKLKLNYSNKVSYKNKINTEYTPFVEYPISIRDISFSITDYTKYEVLKKYILNFKDELLKEVFVFDFFYNEKKQEIKIGFRLVFQSPTSTITEVQVNNIIDVIIKHTGKISGVKIPGLI